MKLDIPAVTHSLRTRGIHVQPNFLSPEAIRNLSAEVFRFGHMDDPNVKKHVVGEGFRLNLVPHRFFRSGKEEELRGLAQIYCTDEIRDLCRKYLGRQWHVTNLIMDYERPSDERLFAWHIDHFKFDRCLKVYLYLNDISPRNGAFCYVPNSHRFIRRFFAQPRLRGYTREALMAKFLEIDSFFRDMDENLNDPFYRDPENLALLREIRTHIRSAKESDDHYAISGKAGTAVIFDTIGFHGGGTLHEGERLIARCHYLNQSVRNTVTDTSERTKAVLRLKKSWQVDRELRGFL